MELFRIVAGGSYSFRQTKIDNNGDTFWGNKDIARFEIAMKNSAIMNVLQPVCDICEKLRDPSLIDGIFSNKLIDPNPFDQRHHEVVDSIFCLSEVRQFNDVRVFQSN